MVIRKKVATCAGARRRPRRSLKKEGHFWQMQQRTDAKQAGQMARRPFKEVNAEFRALVKQELNMLTPQDLALVETTRKKAADRMFLAISVLILAIGAVILLIIRENQTDESIYLLPTPLAGICLGWAVKTILLYYKPEASVMRAARARALEKASPELR